MVDHRQKPKFDTFAEMNWDRFFFLRFSFINLMMINAAISDDIKISSENYRFTLNWTRFSFSFQFIFLFHWEKWISYSSNISFDVCNFLDFVGLFTVLSLHSDWCASLEKLFISNCFVVEFLILIQEVKHHQVGELLRFNWNFYNSEKNLHSPFNSSIDLRRISIFFTTF